jgi:hypothetical protein
MDYFEDEYEALNRYLKEFWALCTKILERRALKRSFIGMAYFTEVEVDYGKY